MELHRLDREIVEAFGQIDDFGGRFAWEAEHEVERDVGLRLLVKLVDGFERTSRVVAPANEAELIVLEALGTKFDHEVTLFAQFLEVGHEAFG